MTFTDAERRLRLVRRTHLKWWTGWTVKAAKEALDPTAMGYKQRVWYLGPHAGQLFDTNGNAGPTVWVDGRIVGAWGQRPTP